MIASFRASTVNSCSELQHFLQCAVQMRRRTSCSSFSFGHATPASSASPHDSDPDYRRTLFVVHVVLVESRPRAGPFLMPFSPPVFAFACDQVTISMRWVLSVL